MRYIIVSVGYNHVAIPYNSGAELGPILAALAESKNVNSVGYGDEEKWVPSSKEPVQFRLIDGERVTIGDDLATLRAQLAEATRSAEQNSKYWLNANAEVTKLKKELEALRIPPPPVTPAAESPADDLSF